MSRSIHTTFKALKGLTKKQIKEQYLDSDSELAMLAKKSFLKENVLKERKQKKPKDN